MNDEVMDYEQSIMDEMMDDERRTRKEEWTSRQGKWMRMKAESLVMDEESIIDQMMNNV
jgi:hypothetical protein